MRYFSDSFLIAFAAIISVAIACSRTPITNKPSEASEASFRDIEISDLEMQASKLKKNKEEEQVQASELQGFSSAKELSDLSLESSTQALGDGSRLSELVNENRPLFDFETPESLSADFSPPVMVNSASLALSNFQQTCSQLVYADSPPTFKDLVSFSIENQVCGSISLFFCIRLSKKSQFDSSLLSTHVTSPNIEINIPCKDESFKDLAVSINSSDDSTNSLSVLVGISSRPSVSQVYLTDDPSCNVGGEWSNLPKQEISRTLLASSKNELGEYRIFAKFIDVFEQESSCKEDSIAFNTEDSLTALLDPSITISDGSFTSSSTVSLSLSGFGHSSDEMYITNDADCTTGGSWEPFAATRSAWTLGQTNASTNVYVKFRNEKGTESNCLSDSIFHDDVAPTSGTIMIGSGSFTSDDQPSVFVSSSGATEMYISNAPNCSTGGVWETYSTSKTKWPLGQTNASATVYVKFRDEAKNESACIDDSITHDNVAPSAPSSLTDGSSTSTSTSSPVIGWNASSDATSGLDRYEIGLGTTAGDNNMMAWSDIGQITSTSLTGLSLVLGGVYFINIRAIDQAGNISEVSSSDGFIYGYSQQAYIKASNSTSFNRYGQTLAISGDTMVVSSYLEDSNQTTITNGATSSTDISASNVGAAYIYRRTGVTWEQEAYIKAANASDLDFFGYSVAISGDTVVIGAYGENGSDTSITNGSTAPNDESSGNAGAVYVYKRTGTTWAQEAYVKADEGDSQDEFGSSVAISGDTIAVGAPKEDSDQTSISNGSTASNNNSASDSGAVYIYKRSGTTWAQEAYIKADNSKTNYEFGRKIALSGDTLVVGNSLESSNLTSVTNGPTASSDISAPDSGAIYVYKRTGSTWVQEAYIKASNAETNDKFGESVAISGDTIVAGSMIEASNLTTITNGPAASPDNSLIGSGAAYVFKRTGASWVQEAYIKASNAGLNDKFASCVGIDGDSIVVGALEEDSNLRSVSHGTTASADNSRSGSGAVYMYERTGALWEQKLYIKPSNSVNNLEFSVDCSISASTIVSSSTKDYGDSKTITNGPTAPTTGFVFDSGAVYVYEK